MHASLLGRFSPKISFTVVSLLSACLPGGSALRYRRGSAHHAWSVFGPSASRCWLMCNARKSLTKTRFPLILKCSSGRAAINLSLRSWVNSASTLAHPRPSVSWRVLTPSSHLVMLSATRSPHFLWSMFEAKNLSTLSTFSVVPGVQALPQAWPSRLQCLDVVCLPSTRRAAPFKLPTSRAATELTSRFSPLLVAIAPATGIAGLSRKVHPLTFGFRHLRPNHDRLSRFRSRLRNELHLLQKNRWRFAAAVRGDVGNKNST